MPVNIYSTVYMDAAIKELKPMYTFLRDRYFGGESKKFKTEKVIFDYDDGEGQIMAPFVMPRVGNVPLEREGFETRELVPPFIAPSRPLSIDDLTKRQAGESLVSTKTPAEREAEYLIGDLAFLDRAITRREEWIAVNTLLDNACTMTHIGDALNKGVDLVAQYYDTGNNHGAFTKSAVWAVGTANKRGTWYEDSCRQVESLIENGRAVTDMIVGSEVADVILSDPWVHAMLDNRRIELGEFDPKQLAEAGVMHIGRLTIAGVPLDIFSYRGQYQDYVEGVKTSLPLFPSKGVLFGAPNTGVRMYGAVTQVEQDQKTYTRSGERIPKHNVDVAHNTKETILTSRPLLAPKMKSPWRACRDVLTA